MAWHGMACHGMADRQCIATDVFNGSSACHIAAPVRGVPDRVVQTGQGTAGRSDAVRACCGDLYTS